MCSCLENGLDRETTLPLEWYTGPLGHLHRVMQRPLYEWGNNRTPMRGRTPDVIDRIGCLCGGVRFAVQGPLAPIQVCHCSQCRKAQGAPLATNIPVPETGFTLEAGADLLQAFESTPGKQRVFCRRCGSPVYSRRDSLPGVLRLRAGTLDGELPVGLAFHAYVGSRANWWPLDAPDGAPRFPEGA